MVNQFLSLSLFLMLLSFFIVMNSVSGFDDVKTHPVMNSLSLAFSNKIKTFDQAPSEEENADQVINDGDTLSRIEAAMGAKIAGFEATRNRFGNVMHVRVPVLNFERAIDIPVSGVSVSYEGGQGYIKGQGAFLPTLISLLKAEKHEIPYRMDMILSVSDDPALLLKHNPKLFQEKVLKVSGFAEKLEGVGLPKKYISAAIGEGQNGYLNIYFHPYESLDLVKGETTKGVGQ
jgi:hypothetical protein